MYKRVYEWMYASQEAVKAGVSTADIAKLWPEATHWGYKEEHHCVVNAVGHGMGLSQYETPTIQRGTSFEFPEILEEGMVVALETYDGVDFVGGCRVENVGVVTKDGWENFYTWPDEEIVVPQHSLLIR